MTLAHEKAQRYAEIIIEGKRELLPEGFPVRKVIQSHSQVSETTAARIQHELYALEFIDKDSRGRYFLPDPKEAYTGTHRHVG